MMGDVHCGSLCAGAVCGTSAGRAKGAVDDGRTMKPGQRCPEGTTEY
jgi:hypothetical protein